MKLKYLLIGLIIVLLSCKSHEHIKQSAPLQFSGIYPHLAMYNNEGTECGTGAIVPWSTSLWVISYGSSNPLGSSDKLYEISSDLKQTVRKESIGGTHANRMIHRESNQLFIGLHAIDAKRKVRTIPYTKMKGRLTGNARHLTDPANKIYVASMEEGFYEIDVKTLEPTTLYPDRGQLTREEQLASLENDLSGSHGKGLYSGQGVLVYSLNGELTPDDQNHYTQHQEPTLEETRKIFNKEDEGAGSLSEWDGKNWKLIRKNQFVEVTGPGDIFGNSNPETDPIWTTGWDHKSVIVGVRNPKTGWGFYRLPKASNTYDGTHGWNTEWPRIRDIGTPENPDYLMTMHGMFWKFPGSFSSSNASGIRPRSSYLKVIGDYARWNNRLVFGCDDSAHKEFLNKRKVKGEIEGPGQSNSNLWFVSLDEPDHLGPNTASGAVWLQENIEANSPSEPFLFTGWPKRSVWISNHGPSNIDVTFEIDDTGEGNWSFLRIEELTSGESKWIEFSEGEIGEWVRLSSSEDASVTAHFSFTGEDNRSTVPDDIFQGITVAGEDANSGGLLYGLGDNRRALGISITINGKVSGYYELDEAMNLVQKNDAETQQFIDEKFAIPENVVTIDKSSVLIVDDAKRRWMLPLGNNANSALIKNAQVRICLEVVTERDLLNCHGTFYELPAENADGFAKIRPISSHNYQIHDYASYRGLLVMTGINPETAKDNSHIIVSDDKKAYLWVGVIDDLWKMGKPTGKGGPWKDTSVKAYEASDPYLIGFYNNKQLTLSHDMNEDVSFTIEVEPVGHGPWMKYKEVTVKAGEEYNYQFPGSFQSRWIRFNSDKDCVATAWLVYD